MKKHIFGFALFSFIVASFAVVFGFFYAPSLPSKEAVKPPVAPVVTRYEPRSSCNLNKNKNNLSYEVLSSQYYVDENRIVSKIRVSLNDSVKAAPSKINVVTTFSSAGNIGRNGFGDYNIVENPFAEGREKIVTVVSRVADGKKIEIDENLYVTVSVNEGDDSSDYKKSDNLTQAKSVLFVYGKISSRNIPLVVAPKEKVREVFVRQ